MTDKIELSEKMKGMVEEFMERCKFGCVDRRGRVSITWLENMTKRLYAILQASNEEAIREKVHPDCFYLGGCGCGNKRLDVKPKKGL